MDLDFTLLIITVAEIAGTIAFAVAGTLTAMRCRLDYFGILVIAVVSATGGGILRDLLLGLTPPAAFIAPVFIIISILSAAALIVLFTHFPQFARKRIASYMFGIINFFDAIGLAVFTTSGMEKAFAAGFMPNFFLCVTVGLFTGIGGGVIRDMLVQRTPMILRKEVYAVISVLGGVLYYALRLSLPFVFAVITVTVCMVAARLLAVKYEWHLPNAVTIGKWLNKNKNS